MATTTNFGWETPDDTDLVKDGALAMRTLGNSIDTSFVDLKGGTTGQNLRKNSNTDLDFTWAGDATNTVVDASGDLLYGTAADTLGRLAIGSTGQVLTVSGGVPSWATPSTSASGLTLVTAQTFTSSSAVNVNSVFTSTYNNYRVIINVTSTSTSNDFDLRLRTSGSDNTNSSYQFTGTNSYSDIDTIYIQRNNGTTAFSRAGNAASADNGATNMIFEFFNPYASIRTGLTYHNISSDGSRVIFDSGSGIFDNTTSFDGFSIIVDTGNITGKVYVYGYQV